MRIEQSFLTRNPYFKAARKIAVKGLMLHSIGCPQPSAQVLINSWNNENYKRACIHGFIDGNTGVIYQTMPWNYRAPHAGGKATETYIGVEMCEPATIKYVGGANWVDLNPAETKKVVMRTYASAVELFAYLCEEYGLNPLADGVILSHSEGHARGIASNHADVAHLWRAFGLSMDGFRNAVNAKINENKGDLSVAQYEELKKENEALKAEINALKAIIGDVYKTAAEVPEYYKDTIEKLIAKGAIKGTGENSLNLPEIIARTLVIVERDKSV